MSYLTKSLPVVLAAGLCTASPALSAVVEFEGAGAENFLTATYVEDGFSFEVITGHYDLFNGSPFGGNSFNIDEDTVGFGSELSTINVTFSGGLFDFDGLSIITAAGLGAYTISSNLGDTIDAASLGTGIVSIDAGFTGISTLTFTQETDGFFEFDNFEASSVSVIVPLPAALPLMVFGLFGLGFAGRRRARS